MSGLQASVIRNCIQASEAEIERHRKRIQVLEALLVTLEAPVELHLLAEGEGEVTALCEAAA